MQTRPRKVNQSTKKKDEKIGYSKEKPEKIVYDDLKKKAENKGLFLILQWENMPKIENNGHLVKSLLVLPFTAPANIIPVLNLSIYMFFN